MSLKKDHENQIIFQPSIFRGMLVFSAGYIAISKQKPQHLNLLGFHGFARIFGAFQHQNISPLCTPEVFQMGMESCLIHGSWKRRCRTWTTIFRFHMVPIIDLRVVVHLFLMLKVEKDHPSMN